MEQNRAGGVGNAIGRECFVSSAVYCSSWYIFNRLTLASFALFASYSNVFATREAEAGARESAPRIVISSYSCGW